MLVVDGRLVAAAMREPAAVTGDGEHTIEELIAIENRNPLRGYGHEKVMTRLSTSEVTHVPARARRLHARRPCCRRARSSGSS